MKVLLINGSPHEHGCTATALDELERIGGKYALVTMCIGGGMGAAGIYELIP